MNEPAEALALRGYDVSAHALCYRHLVPEIQLCAVVEHELDNRGRE